jgi:hypothetical protein
MLSCSPHTCYMPCPSHPPRLDLSDYTWQRVQVMKLLIMQFSPASCYFIPFWSKYSPQQTLSVCSPLMSGNQDSHPYRATGKTTVLYIQFHNVCRFENKFHWTTRRHISEENTFQIFFCCCIPLVM